MGSELPEQRRGRFINPHVNNIRRRPLDFLFWMAGVFKEKDFPLVPEDFAYPLPEQDCDESLPWAQWINHSTYLVHLQGKHLLTDPVFCNRCSPVPGVGPKRRHAPALKIEQLPRIDYVLLSHDHYDHLDKAAVLKLSERFPHLLWIVPYGVKKWFKKLGIEKVVELKWWEEVHLNSYLKVTAVPAQHFSGRKGTHKNPTLWAGFVLEDLLLNKRMYFVGDTGYNEQDFKTIGEKFQTMDLSLIPIGSYAPRVFMAPVHIDPEHAVIIHQEVKSKLSLGMHWKTFRLSDEPMNQPPYDLFLALQERNIHHGDFLPIEPGDKINW